MESQTKKLGHLRWVALLVALAAFTFVNWSFRPARQRDQITRVDDLRRKEAMAFVLGWQSKMVLGQNIADRPKRLHLIGLYLQKLNVTLPHTVEYYLSDPEQDSGDRAQEFAEETFKRLSGNHDIANHFGIASNILLAVARYQAGLQQSNLKGELESLAESLDVPPRLKIVPTKCLADWAIEIERYFEWFLGEEQFRLSILEPCSGNKPQSF
jgi:hypothetical protein